MPAAHDGAAVSGGTKCITGEENTGSGETPARFYKHIANGLFCPAQTVIKWRISCQALAGEGAACEHRVLKH